MTKTSSLSPRTFPFRGSVVRRAQCSCTKATLCITTSFVWIWLAVILQSVRWRTSLSNSTLSVPPQRGRFFVRPKRKRPTFSRITTECSDKEKTNALADESIIPVGAERSRHAEAVSRASFNGEEASGIHDTSLLTKCDVDIRKNSCANVVPSGGIHVPKGR